MTTNELKPGAIGDDLRTVRNRTFDEIAVGDTASIERTPGPLARGRTE